MQSLTLFTAAELGEMGVEPDFDELPLRHYSREGCEIFTLGDRAAAAVELSGGEYALAAAFAVPVPEGWGAGDSLAGLACSGGRMAALYSSGYGRLDMSYTYIYWETLPRNRLPSPAGGGGLRHGALLLLRHHCGFGGAVMKKGAAALIMIFFLALGFAAWGRVFAQ